MKAALLFFLLIAASVLIIALYNFLFITAVGAEIMFLGVFLFGAWVVYIFLERKDA